MKSRTLIRRNKFGEPQAECIADRFELDEVKSPVAGLVFGDEALAHVKPSGERGLGEPLIYPPITQERAQAPLLLGVDRLLRHLTIPCP